MAASGAGIQRFRAAVEAVIAHNRGERQLSNAAARLAPSEAEASALLRRACNFGYCEVREAREAVTVTESVVVVEEAVPPASPTMRISATDLHRPSYHLGPRSGWLNDPNGLVFVGGRYHACFQHQPDRGE